MSIAAPTDPGDPVSSTISDGDDAAKAGNWSQAVAIWERHLESDHPDAAVQRLRWFLQEASGTRNQPRRYANAPVTLLVALGCGLIGTASVLIAEGQSGSVATLLAAVAWLLYITSATLAVAYAFIVGRTPAQGETPLSPAEVERARRLASSLDRDRPLMQADS